MLKKIGITAFMVLVMLNALVAPSPAAEDEKVVNVYFWFEYMSDDVIKGFEEETGIKVVFDTFESLSVLETKLLAGNSGYDIVIPTAAMAERLLKLNLFKKLDKAKFTNYGNLDKATLKAMAKADPGNNFGVPYMWGTAGIVFNEAMVKERLPDADVRSWDLFFKPENISKLADCGVAFVDEYYHVIPIALQYLGLDPHSVKKEDLEKAEKLLLSIRPYVRHFNSGAIIEELATGELCAALTWSGDAGIAGGRAEELNNGIVLDYSIPKEGTLMFIDFLAIPADAKHVENAYKFLDYLMRPQEIAKITNTIWYANGNAASQPYIIEDVKNDPDIYPPKEVMDKLFPETFAPQKDVRRLTRMWTKIKSSK